MRAFLRMAREDLDIAMKQDPENLIGHLRRLDTLGPFGWRTEQQEILDAALERYPRSFTLRTAAMFNAAPNWGGSLETMLAIADSAMRFAEANPRLRHLRGYIFGEAVSGARRDGSLREALLLADSSLAVGEEPRFFLGRARTYYSAGDYVRALEDLNSAMSDWPQSVEVLEFRGRTLYHLARLTPFWRRSRILSAAIKDLRFILVLDPTNELGKEWLEVACSLRMFGCRGGGTG